MSKRVIIDGEGDAWVETSDGSGLYQTTNGRSGFVPSEAILAMYGIRWADTSVRFEGVVEVLPASTTQVTALEAELERVRYDRDCLRDELEQLREDVKDFAEVCDDIYDLAIECLRRKPVP